MFRFFYISTFKYLKVLQLCKMFQESFIELVKSTKHIFLDGPIIKTLYTCGGRTSHHKYLLSPGRRG